MPRNSTQNPRMLPPEHRLLEYRVERFLGAGGFGITYLARDERLGHKVAIKEYLPNDLAMRATDNSVVANTTDDEADFQWGLARFLDEARMLAQFNHPNIVRVHRFFEAHGTSYIAMEYVDGEPLSELLKRRGTLTEAEITEHVLPVTAGLTQVHAAGVLHRDIKPGNIIVRPNGVPVLIDFGSARQAVGAKTRSVTSVVTPGYAPLEQYSTKGSQLPATDIYSLGAVLYRCVTGKVPEDATERVLEDSLIPAAEALAGAYSGALLTAIDTALGIRAEERPRDVATFLDLLKHTVPIPDNGKVARQVTRNPSAEQVSTTRYRGARINWISVGDWIAVCALTFVLVAALLPPSLFQGGEPTTVESSSDQVSSIERTTQLEHGDNGQSAASADEILPDAYAAARDAYARGNFALALSKFRDLAEQRHAGAQFYLGLMHELGFGVPSDFEQAINWYRQSADQGHAQAQYSLGLMYDLGRGVPVDDAQAAMWYTLAAEQGEAASQYNLGVMYSDGEGVPVDNIQAFAWITLGIARGAYPVGRDDQLELVSRRMTDDQIADAQELSRELDAQIPILD